MPVQDILENEKFVEYFFPLSENSLGVHWNLCLQNVFQMMTGQPSLNSTQL